MVGPGPRPQPRHGRLVRGQGRRLLAAVVGGVRGEEVQLRRRLRNPLALGNPAANRERGLLRGEANEERLAVVHVVVAVGNFNVFVFFLLSRRPRSRRLPMRALLPPLRFRSLAAAPSRELALEDLQESGQGRPAQGGALRHPRGGVVRGRGGGAPAIFVRPVAGRRRGGGGGGGGRRQATDPLRDLALALGQDVPPAELVRERLPDRALRSRRDRALEPLRK
mmetsp:Transcript_14306/g.36866  ORF Transcript_14306/g.36866 Transcript_14306/m.36866 type:complete len:223 (-) Transcript_14306:417-1085(-)